MYKIGDNVVHKSHGVGVIHAIEQRKFNNNVNQTFYVIVIQDNGAPKKVFVPVANDFSTQRLRRLIDRDAVSLILKYLSKPIETPEFHGSGSWPRRYRELMEDIHTGDAYNLSKVLKSIKAVSVEKDLSFGERLLYDQAMNLLCKEFAIVTGKPESYLKDEIETAMGE